MKNSVHPIPVLFLLLLLFCCPLATSASDPEQKEKSTVDIDIYSDIQTEYSDNAFRLTESQQTMLDENAQEDIDSQRFDGMDAISDIILSPSIGFRLKTDSPVGGRLKLDASARYHWHTENSVRSHPEFDVEVTNDIGKNGALSIEGNFIFDYFKKNYLSGYDNANGNGNISRDERIYASAIYDQYEGTVEYRHEFLNNKGAALSEVEMAPFAGYSYRMYNSPFGNRDKNIALGGLEMSLEFFSRFDLELIYLFEKVEAPNFRELVLYDEVDSLTDINGDGSLYRNAPLVTRIDRSADRNTIEIKASFELTKAALLFMEYRDRVSEYTSDNPLDIEHYQKKAYRERFRSGIEYEFSKSLSAEFRYTRTSDDDEDGKYIENCYLFTINKKFR